MEMYFVVYQENKNFNKGQIPFLPCFKMYYVPYKCSYQIFRRLISNNQYGMDFTVSL